MSQLDLDLFEQFKQERAEQARQHAIDFGVPDRIILQEETKLWEVVLPVEHQNTTFPLIPVYSGNTLAGAATLGTDGFETVAFVKVDYHTPERLDHENGRKVELRWATIDGRLALVFA